MSSPANSPKKDVSAVYDAQTGSMRSVCTNEKRPRSGIRLDPVSIEPKLGDPLTRVKIGRDTSVDDPEAGKVEPEVKQRDRVELCLHKSHRACISKVLFVQTRVHGFLKRNKAVFKTIFLVLLLIAYLVYFGFAVWYSAAGALVLIVLTSIVILIFTTKIVNRKFGRVIDERCMTPLKRILKSRQLRYCRWLFNICLIIGIITFFAMDICCDVRRVTSFCGLVTFILLAYLTSKNPAKVKWRPVFWGLGLQFLLGIIILRWPPGYIFFSFLGDQVEVFLNYADEGSKFVFGDPEYLHHTMAFKVFPAVVYFSAVISILYYWGIMQFVICKIAWLMQLTMGTTAIESLNAATNIFIGMAESVVMLRPFVPKLTKSELHAVMTGGFATVSGSYIALLVEVGVSIGQR